MNEKTIDQIEEEVLSYKVSDEAVEAAGTRTDIAGAWTFICTGIQCNHTVPMCRTEAASRTFHCLRLENRKLHGALGDVSGQPLCPCSPLAIGREQ